MCTHQVGFEAGFHAQFQNLLLFGIVLKNCTCRAVGAGPAGAVVAGPILTIAPGATHGKRTSRKLCNTLLGYIKKQQIGEFMLLHSKNALEMISQDPNIQLFSGGACSQTEPMLRNYS